VPILCLYPTDRAAYGRLCRIITQGRLRAPKGECRITFDDIVEWNEGLLVMIDARSLLEPCDDRPPGDGRHDGSGIPGNRDSIRESAARIIGVYREVFGDRLYLGAGVHGGSDDDRYLASVDALSRATGVPLVATNDAHYHVPQRRFLQDVLTCIRNRCTLAEAGKTLFANAERYLKPVDDMQRLFIDYPNALARTVEIADRCRFSLDELRYEYPEALCPPGRDPHDFLTELTWSGADDRYPAGVPQKVRRLIEHELKLIRKLKYEPYFLTVWDIVTFARSQDILCQGRGSAANSAVCYCLGITSVDPDRIDLLFERFVSAERNEPPDIDVDFEHERREEVLQYVYNKYGREHAGIVAEVITYRPRSAIRDVGKALGLSLDHVDALAKQHEWWDRMNVRPDFLRQAGLDPDDRTVRMLAKLVGQIVGFPRHLSQHVGGFVITRGPLCEMVPIENAAMPDRTFIEWDKDDIDALGILKVDCLGLGMLTAIHKCLDLLNRHEGTKARRHEEGKGRRDEGAEGRRKDGEGKDSLCPEARRDRGTKGRRDEGTKGRTNEEGSAVSGIRQGDHDGGQEREEDLSRLDCLAQERGFGESHLSDDPGHAERRAVWTDHTDAKGRRFDPIQHRGGKCEANAQRLSSLPGHSTRFTGRTGNADSDCPGIGYDQTNRSSQLAPRRGRSHAPSSNPQPARKTQQAQIELTIHPAVAGPPPSSLRPFVPSSLTSVPPEDPAVYHMVCRADTVGVFQIESRAQMSMLPRLKPRNFYDLVIEVAIVRPGPIQGGMVHPYLRRRNGEEPITYPNEAIRKVLERTLGVPLFQEQAMKLAVVAAGFTPGEADQLRRAMAAWRRNGDITRFREKLVDGMKSNGLSEEFAERCFQQICGFGEYGFPESHAASFALLVYVSCWLKRYHPAAFCAAMLNSQPLGFYQPAQLVRDAREHGVPVLPVDVNHSGYDCRLAELDCEWPMSDCQLNGEKIGNWKSEIGNWKSPIDNPALWGAAGPAVRLGMRLIKGISTEQVAGIERARQDRPFRSVTDLFRRSGASRVTLARLAAADAMRSLGLDRRRALWQVLALSDRPPMFEQLELDEPVPDLPKNTLTERVFADYATVGLSLEAHPISLIRSELARLRVQPNRALKHARQGQRVRVAGLALVRQRPSTAAGITFCTLEDETGTANLIIRPRIFEKHRAAAGRAVAVIAQGHVERQGEVVHVQVNRIEDLSKTLAGLKARSRDFH